MGIFLFISTINFVHTTREIFGVLWRMSQEHDPHGELWFLQGWKLNFFPLLFPSWFSTQNKVRHILSEASKDKKAVRAFLKGVFRFILLKKSWLCSADCRFSFFKRCHKATPSCPLFLRVTQTVKPLRQKNLKTTQASPSFFNSDLLKTVKETRQFETCKFP